MPKALHHVVQAMARQWRVSPSDVQIFDVGHGLVQFVFSSMEIKLRVYQTQPWAYKSAIMHLVPWEEPSQALYDRLQFMSLVIQLMDLPRHCNSVKFACKLVQPLGSLIKDDMYSTRPGGQGQHFVKCLIQIDLLRSIQGRIQAVTPRQLPFWVKLRYEDLPAVCFACGLLGHGHRHCPYLALLPNISEERGHWMMTKPFGYKVRAEDLSEASPSKQKPKHLKPIPYVFHTMVNADGISMPELGHSSMSASSSMICEAAITPPIPSMVSPSSTISLLSGFRCTVSQNLRTFEMKTGFLNCCISQPSSKPTVVPIPAIRGISLCSYIPGSSSLFYCTGPAFMDDVSSYNESHFSEFSMAEIQVLNISDKKRHREGDDEADSPISSKRLKLIPELTIADFPEHALNLELLPEDLMDGDDNLDVHPITDSTSLGMEVRPQGPPPPG
ncbi:hypothetical protein LINGRAHAP2_LOCUS30478 [Linum grandiflorum]